jgi:hypothetical protein
LCPCSAGTKYFSGGPDLYVSLDASDELIPGTTLDLPLVIENRGTITMEFYNAYTIQPQYLPTTALAATVRLLPGNAPVRVRSKAQIAGDIPAGQVIPASFVVEIPEDAPAGVYTMQAVVTYQYVPWVEQQSSDNIEYTFKDGQAVLPVMVSIRRMVLLSVDEADTHAISAGGEGFITFTVRNTGKDTGNRTSVYITQDSTSPVVPFTNGIYIGEFPPAGTARPSFKVSVSKDAEPGQSYPLSLYAVYRDFQGNTVTSSAVSTGVTFGEKVRFERTSGPAVVQPGKTGIVSVTYRNDGTSTVYNAQARLSVIDPFSSDDDTAYLGDLAPGQSAEALFSVKTSAGATAKSYSADSEVQYTDRDNTVFTSDNIPVVITVEPAPGILLYAGVLLVFAVIGGVYLWHRSRKAAGPK